MRLWGSVHDNDNMMTHKGRMACKNARPKSDIPNTWTPRHFTLFSQENFQFCLSTSPFLSFAVTNRLTCPEHHPAGRAGNSWCHLRNCWCCPRSVLMSPHLESRPQCVVIEFPTDKKDKFSPWASFINEQTFSQLTTFTNPEWNNNNNTANHVIANSDCKGRFAVSCAK